MASGLMAPGLEPRRHAMIDPATILTYVAVVLGLFVIPGPAVLLVLGRATSGGRRVGIATGLGVAAGDLVHTAMATFGLSAVLMTSALAFSIVKYAGVAYLLYLGVRALMAAGDDLQLREARRVAAPRAARQAILTEILNPKTALFFLAFLPQFVRPEHGHIILQLGMFGLIFVVMSAAFTTLLAIIAGQASLWLRRHSRIGRWQGRVIGAIYISLGLRLALQQR
jgi:threonine/homoserine/homoserine lactone efflux protein